MSTLQASSEFHTGLHPGMLKLCNVFTRVCVSFVNYARRNVRQICQETTMTQSGKRKCESSTWVKSKKKPWPKKANKNSIDEAKKSQLAASDKCSWYD